MKKNISIKEIAELSGVSTATVSRVINNNGRFSEETRKKVLKVIEETGYQTDYSAKTFRMKKSFSVGILVPDITNHFFSSLVEKIEVILFNQGYSTIICNTARDIDKEKAYLNMLEGKMIDGFIIISGADQFSYNSLNPNKHIPYVCIDREPKNDNIFISSDHYQGAYQATENLITNGSTFPTIIMHKKNSSSSKLRLKGFMQAIEDNGIKFSKEHSILLLPHNDVQAKNRLMLRLHQAPEVDSFFAINDNLALSVISYLKEENISIPEDIQIIGFDDIPAAKYVSPQLSTVKQDTDTIATKATDSLLQLIKGRLNTKNNTHLVPVKIILRESTRQL